MVPYRPGFDGAFLVTVWDTPYEGFALVGVYGGQDIVGDACTVRVWVRATFAEASPLQGCKV